MNESINSKNTKLFYSFEISTRKGAPLQVKVNLFQITQNFIKKFIEKNPNPSPQFAAEAKEACQKLKNDGFLEVDFRSVNEQYCHLARIIARYGEDFTNNRDSYLKTKYKERNSLPDQQSSSRTKQKTQPIQRASSQENLESSKNLPQKFEKLPENLEQSIKLLKKDEKLPEIEENNQILIMSEPDVKDLMKSLPKYDASEYKNFRSYLNKCKHYFSLVGLTTASKKIKMVEYAVSGIEEKTGLVEQCATEHANDYDKFVEKCCESIDGMVVLKEGQIIKKIFNLRVDDYGSVKEYYHKFVEMKTAGGPTVKIKDEVMIEAFINGLDQTSRAVLRGQSGKTLHENFKLAENIFEKPKASDYQVNYVNNRQNHRNSKPKGGYKPGPAPTTSTSKPKFKGQCYKCKGRGHVANDCKKWKRFLEWDKKSSTGRVGAVRGDEDLDLDSDTEARLERLRLEEDDHA